MIKLKNIIGLPTLEWHLNNKRTLSENVYRYSSESFIQLFTEARQAWRDGKIQLNEFDEQLLRETDIGEYGMYEGESVPLDLPMLSEQMDIYDDIANSEFGMDYDQLGSNEKEWVRDEIDNMEMRESKYETEETIQQTIDRLKARIANQRDGGNVPFLTQKIKDLEKSIEEAKYKGKDVPLNKPKRGGSKKFYVYVKNKKGNVQKVSFGGTTGLNVKIDEPGARSSFAARHKCATKKDKTKPGYWSCNIGRYWKSLGGSRNFSGYW